MSSALAPNTVAAAALADQLARLGVVPPERMAELLAEFPGGGPLALVDHLTAQGELTPFQAVRVKGGEAKSLVLGPYLLTRVHGPGVLGLVYRAVHRPSGAGVAVRVLPLRSLWRARQAKQLVRTLAAVAHPGVVPLADAGSANGLHYLVWPLAEGRTLAERVRPGDPLPPPAAAGLLAAIADALVACHERRVVHGLVTPLAVGIGPDGTPKLLELGAGAVLAQNLASGESMLDTLTTGVAVGGLVDYAAPELLGDPAAPTPATDQYGLGAVGYFALTGHSPYPDGELTGRLLAQRTGRPVPVGTANPAVPAELAAVIDRMLSPAPAERFPDLSEVREVLAAFAGPLLEPDPEGGRHEIAEFVPADGDSLGSITWSSPALPGRDGSDASVEFDLPDPTPEVHPDQMGVPFAPAPADEGMTDTPPRAEQTENELPKLPPAGSSPALPIPPSPAQADARHMANPRKTSGVRAPDPRATMPRPVQWHTAGDDLDRPPADEPTEKPASRSILWRALKRNLLFWQAATDTVQVSVFGPPAVSPGQTARVTVYLHPPDAADSVRTLSRAFQHDAELIGSGYVAREVGRAAELAVHVLASNAAASKSVQTCVWRGTPHRLGFDLHVPWESPGGPAPGLVSVGRGDVRIGKVAFNLHILPRKG